MTDHPAVRVGVFSSSQFAEVPEFRDTRRRQLLDRFAPLEYSNCLFEYDEIPVVAAGEEATACDPEPRPFPITSLDACRAVTLEEFCDLVLLHTLLDLTGWVRCGDCGASIGRESGYVAYLDQSLDLRVFHTDSESNSERVSAELDAFLSSL